MEFLSSIWETWRNNQSPCAKCPNNDSNNYWYPFYGLGNYQSPLMIIADTPAYNIEGMEYRTQKNAHDYYNPSNDFNQIVSSHLTQRLESSTNKLIEILKHIADCISLDVKDLYFTNAKKCGDIPNNKNGNNQARKICGENFLLTEIKTINPDVVITVGANPFKQIKNFFQLETNDSVINNHCKIFFNHSTETFLVVLAHWGYFRRNNLLDKYYNDIKQTLQKIISNGNRYIEKCRISNSR